MAEASGPNTYTLQVVKEHNKSDDLWIVIDGKVYDVTKFRHEHPGGEDALDEVAGRDATTEFNDVGHSQEAKEMLKKYYIGDLAGGSVIAKASVRQICYAIGAFATGLLAVIIVRRLIASK
ncbi:cytochrome b5 isoform X2 [Eurosta solidaginis]|uniref:cytochrome b5 isoform X2 n=1 Tax=Eurosta solidaginis TaxID=178769 RepID=UPI0035306C2D